MKILKGLTLVVLSLLLFLSLSIFALLLTLNNTILNPNFLTSQLDRLDVSASVEEALSEQMPTEELPEELRTTLVSIITELEPLIKERIDVAADPIFDYLLGKKQSMDLALTLRNTVLTSDFVASILDTLDLASLAEEILSEQIPEEEFPEELRTALVSSITELEPTIKAELIAAADPILDYLLGEKQSLSIVISSEPVVESLKDILREAFLESPPAEFTDLPQSTLERYFNEFFEEFTEMIPATFELNETLLPAEIPAQITEAIAGAEDELKQAKQGMAEAIAATEDRLEQARQYVGYFQLGYTLFIVFMLLLIGGIVPLNRQVRSFTRKLGIIFLSSGILEYAGIFVAKSFVGTQIAQLAIPNSLQEWLPSLASDFLAPLQIFSLVLLIGGIALIVVSFVYKPRQPSSGADDQLIQTDPDNKPIP